MKYNTVIWDLDGTLLDTLNDLCNATNFALRHHGLNERTIDEVRRFVGNGVRKLIERAVPSDTDSVLTDAVFNTFRTYYVEHCRETTCLYEGVGNVLRQLHDMGVHQAVVSNKLQAGVTELADEWFADTIDVAIGEREGINRKPARDMIDIALCELEQTSRMNAKDINAVYIGDSEVDIMTAKNAGMPCISVLWGFRDKDFLMANGAETLVSNPEEIIRLITQ